MLNNLKIQTLVLYCVHFIVQVLSYRIPFLLSSITDLMLFPPKDKPQIANEIASVAGINVTMDPVLTSAMSLHCGTCHCIIVYVMVVSCTLVIYLICIPKSKGRRPESEVVHIRHIMRAQDSTDMCHAG